MNNLLRPFDAVAAKRGESICTVTGAECTYIAGPDKNDNIVVERNGVFFIGNAVYYRMDPLCWISGRPVYLGDQLYVCNGDVPYTVSSKGKDGILYFRGGNRAHQSQCSWEVVRLTPKKEEPKLKKAKHEMWVNVYKNGQMYGHMTELEAHAKVVDGCVATVRIEWEDEPSL